MLRIPVGGVAPRFKAGCAKGRKEQPFRPAVQHKMNLHSVLLNDSFALDFICATPLEQFQILPLSAQVYPASASISSLEVCNLFPQVSTDSEFVYISGAGLAAKLTS